MSSFGSNTTLFSKMIRQFLKLVTYPLTIQKAKRTLLFFCTTPFPDNIPLQAHYHSIITYNSTTLMNHHSSSSLCHLHNVLYKYLHNLCINYYRECRIHMKLLDFGLPVTEIHRNLRMSPWTVINTYNW